MAILLSALEAYAALRSVDRAMGQDPVNPWGFDLNVRTQ